MNVLPGNFLAYFSFINILTNNKMDIQIRDITKVGGLISFILDQSSI